MSGTHEKDPKGICKSSDWPTWGPLQHCPQQCYNSLNRIGSHKLALMK